MKKGLNCHVLVLVALGLSESKGDEDATLTTAMIRDATSPKPTSIYRRINVPYGPNNIRAPSNLFRLMSQGLRTSTDHPDSSNRPGTWQGFQNQWKEVWGDYNDQWNENWKNDQEKLRDYHELWETWKNNENKWKEYPDYSAQTNEQWRDFQNKLVDTFNVSKLWIKGTDKFKEVQEQFKNFPDHLKKLNMSGLMQQMEKKWNDGKDEWKLFSDQVKDRWEKISNKTVSLYHRNNWRKQGIGQLWDWDIWCYLQPKTGKGDKNIQRFYYNVQTGQCENFTYAGSDGNQNSFDNRPDCEKNCEGPSDIPQRISQSDSCSFQPDAGFCLAMFPKYYYDINEARCKNFVYGGCGGNMNRFTTLYECMRVCNLSVIVERY